MLKKWIDKKEIEKEKIEDIDDNINTLKEEILKIKTTLNKLIDFINESQFLKTKSSISQLLRSINSFSLCRPKNINIYCKLKAYFILYIIFYFY